MTQPYYQSETLTVYCDDARVVLPSLHNIHLCVTDPPYKIIGGGNSGNMMKGGIFDQSVYDHSGKLFDCITFDEWMPLVYAALAPNADFYTMSNDKNLFASQVAAFAAGFKLHNILVWKKDNVTPNKYYMKCIEFTLYLWKGRSRNINNMGESQFDDTPNVKKKTHPTQKPVPVMAKYIRNSCNEGDTVLDPFAGSGATILAALALGRKAIAIETNRLYCDELIRKAKELEHGAGR
jgi:DNA modification methylase